MRPYSGAHERGTLGVRRHVARQQRKIPGIGLHGNDPGCWKTREKIRRRVAGIGTAVDDEARLAQVVEAAVFELEEYFEKRLAIRRARTQKQRMQRRPRMQAPLGDWPDVRPCQQ